MSAGGGGGGGGGGGAATSRVMRHAVRLHRRQVARAVHGARRARRVSWWRRRPRAVALQDEVAKLGASGEERLRRAFNAIASHDSGQVRNGVAREDLVSSQQRANCHDARLGARSTRRSSSRSSPSARATRRRPPRPRKCCAFRRRRSVAVCQHRAERWWRAHPAAADSPFCGRPVSPPPEGHRERRGMDATSHTLTESLARALGTRNGDLPPLSRAGRGSRTTSTDRRLAALPPAFWPTRTRTTYSRSTSFCSFTPR